MDQTKTLSEILLSLGFFSALGTTECVGMPGSHQLVTKREPKIYDSNNGVFVMYDEEGRPWIKATKQLASSDHFALNTMEENRGAYVPHSNDGGHFINHILPRLLAGERDIQIE